jgi:hypothetical protein
MTRGWVRAGLAGALGALLLAGCAQSTQESGEVTHMEGEGSW